MNRAPEFTITWLSSVLTGRIFPTAIFFADTDMTMIGWGTLTSTLRPEIVISPCSMEEQKDWKLLESRLNAALRRNDLRAVPLLRSIPNHKFTPGMSFADFRKQYRPASLYYRDIFSDGQEAIVVEETSQHAFVASGGVVMTLDNT